MHGESHAITRCQDHGRGCMRIEQPHIGATHDMPAGGRRYGQDASLNAADHHGARFYFETRDGQSRSAEHRVKTCQVWKARDGADRQDMVVD